LLRKMLQLPEVVVNAVEHLAPITCPTMRWIWPRPTPTSTDTAASSILNRRP
jgi:hypothetical protein